MLMLNQTNCGEDCPSGFKNVMRDGTSETMVDGTKCLGVGFPHQWCCPADAPLPTCTWRGHRNSGICKPGCSEGEVLQQPSFLRTCFCTNTFFQVEVGTLETGCNFNHQSACCTESGSTFAYQQCKWVGGDAICSKAGGHADCPSDYPTFLVASSNAAGGQPSCDTGARSYCCKGSQPPAAFTDCKWHTQATGRVKGDKQCETSCPKDTVRLSMQHLGECTNGGGYDWGAYCCKGEPPKKLEPRDPTTSNVSDPFIYPQTIRHPLIRPALSQNQYSDFVALLKSYMKDPTCPNTSPHVDYFHGDPAVKRSLTSRQECSANNNFLRLVQWMSTLIVNPIFAMNSPAIITAWNTLVANVIDDGLLYLSLLRQRDLTNWDPIAMMTDVLLDAQSAGEGIREYQAAAPLICEIESTRKRDVSGLELLVRIAAFVAQLQLSLIMKNGTNILLLRLRLTMRLQWLTAVI